MPEPVDDMYPDLLRTGLDRLEKLGVGRELLPLFAALDYFRRDLQSRQGVEGILDVTLQYLRGLDLFQTLALYRVNPEDRGFDLALCSPEADRDRIESTVQAQIQSGRFAVALREASALTFFDDGPGDGCARGVLHRLAVPGEVLGMFCGILRQELPPTNEIAFSLLSLLLGASSDAQATACESAKLSSQISTLSDLIPICAWCRRIRGDRGYWEKVEGFIRNQLATPLSHGICPDCQYQLLSGLGSSSGTPPPRLRN